MNDFSYKGLNKTKNYFEGWYLKVVDEKSNTTFAIIFGVSLYTGDPHSFIQIASSEDNIPYYYRFDINDFYCNRESIRIKDNIFGVHDIKINVEQFEIDLSIKPTTQLKKHGLTNSAMGCVKLLPLCTYHEIIFMNAIVDGKMIINDKVIDVHGTGYMEKNWGSHFPKEWLWIETNHFKNNNASLTLGMAKLVGDKSGFFCILNVEGEELRFATYNCFKINVVEDKDDIKIVIVKGDICLIINTTIGNTTKFIGPCKKAEMKRVIEECLTSTMTIKLYKDGSLILDDAADHVSIENEYNAN